MNIKRILCPVDYSEFNQKSNQYASVLAQSTGAEIVYMHVLVPEVPYGGYAYVEKHEDAERDLRRLEEIKPTLPGINASHVVEVGSPTERIVEYARENDIDLIVMATHGRTGLGRVLMGSVAEAVVRKADCPVLALKSTSDVPTPG